MRQTITFQVFGIPRPGGSKTAFYNKKLGRAMMTDASGAKGVAWRDSVIAAALAAYDGPVLHGALALGVAFSFSRPKSHYGTGRNADRLKPSAPRFHTQRPDATKLLRSLEDALTGIIWKDDAQLSVKAVKGWVDRSVRGGASVVIILPEGEAELRAIFDGLPEGGDEC